MFIILPLEGEWLKKKQLANLSISIIYERQNMLEKEMSSSKDKRD